MTLEPAARIRNVQSPVIPLVGEWIAAHPGTISLGQGVVHYAPPASVVEAVAAASAEIRIGKYGAVKGSVELLAKIREKVTKENSLQLDEAEVACTAGANMAFMNAVQAICDVGDEIILLSPYYFNHEMAIEIAGCRATIVPTDDECQIDLVALTSAITPRTRAIVTVSPNNPTGAVYPTSVQEHVNRLCADRGLFHISDEAYEYFQYEGSHFSPGSLPGADRHTISLFSLSKSYGMAGWRVGYMVYPRCLDASIKKIQDTNLICPPIISQVAGLAAMQVGADWVRKQNAGFREVRDMVLSELAALGERVRVPTPSGALYVLVDTQTQGSDLDLVQSLIREFGVATMPGSTFGIHDRCVLRVAFGALQKDVVSEGIGRLVRGLGELL